MLPDLIPERWYPILESARLRRRPVGVRRLERDLVLWRDADGRAVALPGACPHRGAALGDGRVVDGQLACPWHGFRFDGGGRCTLMPCEGSRARIPSALDLKPLPVREAHGLVWLWWGEARAELPPVAFFDDVTPELRGTTQASYVLPYPYSRMMETNLDIHHTPFVHGSVFPGLGTRVEPYEAHLDGDRIVTHGELRREGRDKGMAFRLDALLPSLVRLAFGRGLYAVVAATPVDESHAWMWFRYYQDYTRLPIAGKLVTWLSVQSELRVVQKQDWRVFAKLPKGRLDEVKHHYVRADLGIALYRKRLAELTAPQAKLAVHA